MSADMSVLGNLCRSLYLGAARIFKMLIFIITILMSSLSLHYLGTSGCGFSAPTNLTRTPNPDVRNPVFGTFNSNLCFVLNIYHIGLMIPASVLMFLYLIVGTFCFKHHKNTLEAYIQNHRRELVFLILACLITLTSMAMSCLFEVIIYPCKPCKEAANTKDEDAKNMSLVNTMTWFATFMWAGLGGVGVTTFCIFHELVKNKASGID